MAPHAVEPPELLPLGSAAGVGDEWNVIGVISGEGDGAVRSRLVGSAKIFGKPRQVVGTDLDFKSAVVDVVADLLPDQHQLLAQLADFGAGSIVPVYTGAPEVAQGAV